MRDATKDRLSGDRLLMSEDMSRSPAEAGSYKSKPNSTTS